MSNVHHALLVETSVEEGDVLVSEVLSVLNISEEKNPDVRRCVFEKLSIDAVRDLNESIRATPLAGKKTVTFIFAEEINIEAQNALLKITEEPPHHAYIVLVLQNKGILLPTLLSRFMIFERESSTSENILAKEFIASTVSVRQKMIKKILRDKDIYSARILVRGLGVLLAGEDCFDDVKTKMTYLKRVLEYNQFLVEPGVSMKMILEHLALTTPKHSF